MKLFTAIGVSHLSFSDGKLIKKKYRKFELTKTEKLTDSLYHFIFQKENMPIHSYYFIVDDLETERYLFVENNEYYKDFCKQFFRVPFMMPETDMDVYLDVHKPEEVYKQVNQVYRDHFYEEHESMPISHFFGQQEWHGNAYLIANRAALLELKDAIDTALLHGESRTVSFPSDGEGYYTYIKCVDEDFDWEQVDMPYHNPKYFSREEAEPYKSFTHYKNHLR
ncbi:hypothetical protein GKZ89_16140 [Bacillus mangrovi]|uniref:Uncharacterized protein n=1 Tax=Metabacillus mangrovi TaxID=1491830 RepID=A0A7X2S791_9BACI|nr:hypothetical protein [Metabacillus mangrovi]MTH54933.1 hypothetical protein [Metabacillus mangrovi]